MAQCFLIQALILTNFAIFALGGPLQRASKGPGPDLAKFGYFCIKRSFTESLEGPGMARASLTLLATSMK